MNDLQRYVIACDFAARAHESQRRKNAAKTPYINHPLGVARILVENNVHDRSTLIAAVLHDTVEDTPVSCEQILRNFGKDVLAIIVEVTDDKALPKYERKRLQVANAASKSRKAKRVKLADKLYNCRSLMEEPLPEWGVERIQGYFVWSRAVVIQMKGVLPGIDAELEKIFCKGTFNLGGVCHPCIPKDVDLDEALEAYYELLKKEN